MDAISTSRGSWVVTLGLVICFWAPAPAQGSDEEVRGAVAGLDRAIARFQREGVQPGPQDVDGPEQVLSRAANDFAARGDWKQAADAFVQLNRAERMVGRWDSAIAYADKAAVAARNARNGELEARALLGRSRAELSRKGLTQAALDVEAAIRAAGDKADAKLRFDLAGQKAAVQVAMGQTNAAAETLGHAFELKDIKDDQLVYGYLDRGDIFFQIAGRCDREPVYDVCREAIKQGGQDYRRAADVARKLEWPGLEKLAREQSNLLGVKGALVDRQQHMAGLGGNALFRPQRAADVLVTESFATSGAGGPQAAQLEEIYRQSKQQEKQAGGFALTSSARSLHTDGLMRQVKGDHAGALASFQKAVDALEQDQRALPDDASRMAFFAEYLPVYVNATQELLDAKRFDEAFAMIERSRARSMAELLAGRRLDVGGSKENALYGDTLRLDREIAVKQADRFLLASSSAPAGDLAAADAELAHLRESRQRVVARMGSEAPRLQTLTAARTLRLSDLQALAKSDGCEVLEYLVTDTNLIVIYISPTEMRPKNVFVPRAALAAAIKDLQSSLTTPDRPFDHKRARELYLQLIEPVRRFVHGERLLILPNDVLAALPFEILEDPSDGTPIGTRFELAYAPSATIYAGLRPWSPGTGKKLLAVADPSLEREGHEVERVAAVYHAGGGWPRDRLIPKSKLRQNARGVDVVHLSVHGTFNSGEPLLSDLLLAREGSDDGRLTAAEMFGLPLGKTALVVLSACESGRTETSGGNEALGMVRGLLYAGAGALVLSRWKVNADSTAQWMETFHREAQTHGLAQAARAALRDVRAKHEHPYYWAAYSLVGRPS